MARRKSIKGSEQHFWGDEPEWHDAPEQGTSEFNIFKTRAMAWYSSRNKIVDFMPNLWKWMKEQKYTAADIRAVKAADKITMPIVLNATMALRGMPNEETAWTREQLAERIIIGRKITIKKEDAKKAEYKPSIQDRMREQLSDLIAEVDDWEDISHTNKKFNPKLFSWLKSNKVAQAHINKILEYYNPKKAEIEEALDKNADPQIKEGYSTSSKAELKRLMKFYEQIIEDLESYLTVKQVTRKVRTKKAPSKDKLVKGLKYKPEDTDLKIASIHPTKIIGCHTLWFYNTKTRKLGKYVADKNASQLTLKGSTIIGFDPKLSFSKTIRKPEEQLKEFMGAGKVKLRKFLENIKAVDLKLTGRINKDCILLKVT